MLISNLVWSNGIGVLNVNSRKAMEVAKEELIHPDIGFLDEEHGESS